MKKKLMKKGLLLWVAKLILYPLTAVFFSFAMIFTSSFCFLLELLIYATNSSFAAFSFSSSSLKNVL